MCILCVLARAAMISQMHSYGTTLIHLSILTLFRIEEKPMSNNCYHCNKYFEITKGNGKWRPVFDFAPNKKVKA